MLRLFLRAALIFLLIGATWGAGVFLRRYAPTDAPIRLPSALELRLKAGDLIFRVGNEWQSDAVRGAESLLANRKKRSDPYSHVGMLIGAPGHWQVLHSTPAEAPGRPDAVVIDALDFFLAPERARGIAIYRVEADDETRTAAVHHARARLGVPFHIVADDTKGQYCTTLIWYVWQRAGVDLGARFEHLNVPFAAGNYLLPHSLRTARRLQLLHVAGSE
ncbi:MAG: hypothetical protein LBU45_06095 [Azoarcus sp.]|jgi:cell wall-associated NlpC family hydrolase|nr:hypothetical protein [Azoarcus sp.]